MIVIPVISEDDWDVDPATIVDAALDRRGGTGSSLSQQACRGLDRTRGRWHDYCNDRIEQRERYEDLLKDAIDDVSDQVAMEIEKQLQCDGYATVHEDSQTAGTPLAEIDPRGRYKEAARRAVATRWQPPPALLEAAHGLSAVRSP